jgi:hypothetical protein
LTRIDKTKKDNDVDFCFVFVDMKPIEKLNELSPSATCDIDYESPSVQINNDLMKVQLRVDDREVKRRELESRESL